MRRKLLLAFVIACTSLTARAAVEIRLWHAVSGWPGVELEQLVERFNALQRAYRVLPGYTCEAPAAAREARRHGAALLALPFDASTVLYYNRDAFRRAKLDPAAPPKTWYEMAPALGALVASGQACGYTTAAPAGMLLDGLGGWHDEARLSMDNVMVRWVAMLASWQKSGYFSYSKRADEAETRFAAGECALLTAPLARHADLRARAKFDLEVVALPAYDDVSVAAHRGATGLWVMAGRPQAEYRGVERLLAFLARPEVQAEWRSKTGSASLAPAGYDPAALREIIDQELEAVWGGSKTPLDALNAAVARGNLLIGSGR
jgi:sn-glycerol 3-phosphate transport system substrate-binding protein